MSSPMLHRIVLVGFMGAGKSSVGRALASQLSWRFEDLDEVVVKRSGRTIETWFRDMGEDAFRAEEDAVAQELLGEIRLVLASGGGWATRPRRLTELPPGTVSIWLDVDADEAVRRIEADSVLRPLLDGPEPQEEARRLLDSRRDACDSADVRVDTNGRSVEDVTSRILEILENAGTRIEAE